MQPCTTAQARGWGARGLPPDRALDRQATKAGLWTNSYTWTRERRHFEL
ncbi:hypothetical protein [Streptomyces sp. NPDC056255]